MEDALHSIVLLSRDNPEQLAARVEELTSPAHRLAGRFEIICVDDASRDENLLGITRLLTDRPFVRLFRLDTPGGLGAALNVGIDAARGSIIASFPSNGKYGVGRLEELVEQLNRFDLVFAKRRRGLVAKNLQRLSRIPRWLLTGLEVHDPDILCWAAHTEAVRGTNLTGGIHHWLAPLVSLRGYRVGEIRVTSHEQPLAIRDTWPNPLDLLGIWWQGQRTSGVLAREIPLVTGTTATLRIAPLSKFPQGDPAQDLPDERLLEGSGRDKQTPKQPTAHRESA